MPAKTSAKKPPKQKSPERPREGASSILPRAELDQLDIDVDFILRTVGEHDLYRVYVDVETKKGKTKAKYDIYPYTPEDENDEDEE